MGKLTKLGGVIAAISMSAYLQGCSSGDSFVQELEPASSGATVGGTAAKGVLIDADCEVTNTAGKVLFTTVGRDVACTGQDGNYNVKLSTNPKTPVIVRVFLRYDDNNNLETKMRCDNPTGCAGGVPFGGEVTQLGDDFSMRAIVPKVEEGTETLSVSVTPWTEAAAERAITQSGGVASVTEEATRQANGEVASILNNILGLEGTDDAFDEDFLDIPMPDLSNPKASSVSDAADRRRAALLSIATGALLKKQDSDPSATPASIISDLSSSFKDDGEFNVNDSATNVKSEDKVNLASIVSDIAATAGALSDALSTDTEGATELTTLLGTSDLTTELSSIQESAETLASEKEAVTDANEDPTKPVEVVSTALSAYEKAKRTAVNLVNLLNAGKDGLDDNNETTNTVFEDVANVVNGSSVNFDNGLELMAELMEGAASMILAKANDDISAFSACTTEGENFTCTAAQLAATLDDPWATLNWAMAGNVAYDHASRTVTATDVTVNGIVLALTMEGSESTSLPSYTVSSATVMLPDDAESPEDQPDITFGETIVSGSTASESGSFSIDAKDVTIDLKDYKLVATTLKATRDLTLRDTLLTNFRLAGDLMIGADTQVSTVKEANKGKRVTFTLAFKGNRTGLPSDATSLPMPADETADNFLAATGIQFKLGFPTQVTPFVVDSAGEIQPGSQTTGVFSATLGGTRDAVKGGDVTQLVLKFNGGDVNASLTGDLTVEKTTEGGVETQTTTYTVGDTSTLITLVLADTGTVRSVSGTITSKADGTSLGTINGSGTLTVEDPDSSDFVSVSLPAALLTGQTQTQ